MNHYCCLPIAALNALRFYGRRSDVEPGHPGWDQWVDRWGCRHGAATGVDALLNGLGLRRVPMPFTFRAVQEALGLGIPVLLNLTHDSSGAGFHSALAVAVEGDRVLVINPHGARGPVEKWMPWSSLTFATGSPDPAMRNQALVLAGGATAGGPVISDYTRLGEYLREPGARVFPAPQGCNPPADRVAFWLAAGHQNRDAVRAAIPPHKRTAWIAVDEVFRMFEEHAPLPTRERDVLAALRTWADGEGVAVSPTRQREIYIPPDWTQNVRWLNVQTALKTTAILMAEQPTTLRRLIAAASDIIWLIVLALVRRPEGYPQPSDQREEVAQWLACWEQRLHERLRFVVPTKGDVVRGSSVGVSPGEVVAYHGGTYDGGPFRGSVLYLATTPEMAESYVDMHGDEAGALREFRVRLRNPAPKAVVFASAEAVGIDPTTYTPASVFDAALQGDDEVAALVDDLRRQGYDGAILEDIAYGAEIAEPVYVVFDWRAVEPVAGGDVGGARVPVQHRRRARINRELQSAPAAVRALVRELGQALGDKRGGQTLEAIANARDAGAPDLKSAVLAALQQARGTDIKNVILAEALRLRPPGRLVHVIDLAENLKGMGYSGPQIKAGLHDLAMAGRIEMHPWTGGVHDVPHLDAFPHFGHARMMGRPHYQGYFHVLEGPSTGVVSGPAQSDVVERIRELLEDYTDPKWGAGHCANLALAVQRVLAQHGITAVIEMDWHEGREGTLDTPRSPLADGYFGGNHVRARVGDVVLDSPPGWKLARMITNPANFGPDFGPWEFRPATVEQIAAADVCVSKPMITRIANKLTRDLG